MTETASTETSRSPARRMRLFRAADAKPIDSEQMPYAGVDASVEDAFQRMAELEVGAGVGDRTMMVFADEKTGLSLAHVWFKSGYTLPRHSHDADCIYYVLAGELQMGSQVLRRGDGIFVPKDAAYTYVAGSEGVEVLEFRNRTAVHFMFENNRPADWDKVLAAFASGKPRWPGEQPPSGTQSGVSPIS